MIKFGLIAVLFLFLPVFLQAQDGETRFTQRLIWPEDKYARRYEVIIEKQEGGEYRELLRELSSELFIQVSLSPGKYRCRVITYDFMNRPGPEPEWRYLEVLAVPNPKPINLTDNDEQAHLEQVHLELAQTATDADKKVNLFLSAAWAPSFTISDEGNRFFERDMALSGAIVRLGVAGAGGTSSGSFFNINPGLELPVSYNFFHTGSGEPAHLLAFGLNLTALKWLPGDRTALTFRLGAGYGLLFTGDRDTTASFSGAQSIHINAGISFLLFVMSHWYLETGLDYAHWFTSPASYYFRPWLGIGYKK